MYVIVQTHILRRPPPQQTAPTVLEVPDIPPFLDGDRHIRLTCGHDHATLLAELLELRIPARIQDALQHLRYRDGTL